MDNFSIIHVGYPLCNQEFFNSVFQEFKNKKIVSQNKTILNNILFNDVNFQNKSDIIKELKPNNNIISHAGILGDVYNGGLNMYANCKKLYDNFGKNSKIIFCKKNQVDLLDEVYRMYVFCGGTIKFDKWFKKNQKFQQSVTSNFSINAFNFYKIIETYESFFGRKNIKIILSEELEENHQKVINELANFLKCKISSPTSVINSNNLLKTDLVINSLKFINHFFLGINRTDALVNSYMLNMRCYFRVIDRYLNKLGFRSKKFLIPDPKILQNLKLDNQKLFELYSLNKSYIKRYSLGLF